MAIKERICPVIHRGNGSTTVFPWNFLIETADHLVVRLRNDDTKTDIVLGSNQYTASGIGNPNGGTITYNPGVPIGPSQRLSIDRVVPYSQAQSIYNQYGFHPESVQDGLDQIVKQTQQLACGVKHSLKTNIWAEDVDTTLPEAESDKYLGWSVDGKSIVNKGSPASGTDEGFSALYTDVTKQRTLAINENPLVGGGFPQTATDQISQLLTGQNAEQNLPRQAPVDLAQVFVTPLTETSMNFVHPTTPFIEIEGFNHRVVPVQISTILQNSPVNIPLFEPVRTNNCGFLTFRYIGDKPIHTVLQGDLTLASRTGNFVPDAYQRIILSLGGANLPQLEYGQNRGQRYLGSSSGAFGTTQKVRDYLQFNDECFPVDSTVLSDISAAPNLYTGSEYGYLTTNDGMGGSNPDLVTDDPPGSGDPVPPETQTTTFIDVSTVDCSEHCFAMTFDGVSTRSRIQYRDANGDLQPFNGQSMNYSSYRVFRLPIGTQEFRIYYSGPGDTANDNNVEIKQIGTTVSGNYDPLKGYFGLHTMTVSRDIVLWPGSIYFFSMLIDVYNGAIVREDAIRYQSGGFTFLFDSGELRKTFSNKMVEW